jgi:hypothetical protein
MLLSAWKVVPPPMSGGEEGDDGFATPQCVQGEAKVVRMPPVGDGEEQLDEGGEQLNEGEEEPNEGEEQLKDGDGDGRQAATVVSCVPVLGEKRRPAAGSTDRL